MKERTKPKSGPVLTSADISRIFRIVRKNWLIVAGLGLIAWGIGYLYAYKQSDIFSASTQILLKSNDNFNSGSVITDNSGYYGNTYKTYIDNSNEIRIIRSQDMIERTLRRLDFDISYYLIGRIRTTEVYGGVPFSVKLVDINNRLYETQIRFKALNYNDYQLSYTLDDKPITVKGSFGVELNENDLHLIINRKPSFSRRLVADGKMGEYFIQPHRIESLSASYLQRLNVENPEYTNVLKITLQDVIPQRAVKFLDTLSQVYIENSLNSRIEVNQNTLFFIERQMNEVENILDNIEDSLQRFKEVNSVLDINREGEEYFKKVVDYDNRSNTIDLQLDGLDSLENYARNTKDPAFLPPSAYIISDDQFEVKSLTELYEMQLRLNEMRVKAKDDNPGVKDLLQRIKSSKNDLLQYLANTRKALLERQKGTREMFSSYVEKIQTLPLKQRGLLSITRKQKVNEDLYVFLLQRKASNIISKASIVPDSKVIEKARSMGIVSTNSTKTILIFIIAGLLIAVVIVYIRIYFFSRVETYDELRSVTTLPVLGDVTFDSGIKELLIAAEYQPKSPLAESFRTIRTNLQYMATSEGSNVIVITSNSPGEGKTFCSLNIASSIAKTGKRVVLLELDLHRPRVHKGLKLESDKGISTLLIGKHKPEEVLVHTEIEHLDVILAGPLPPNPSELIHQPQMTELIDYCKANYDFVVIDTPPVGLITDAFVMMRFASVLLFVINTRYAYREAINNAHEIAAMNETLHFGFILNGVKHRRSKYYYRRYGYGYGYGYGGGYGGYGGYGGGSYGSYGSYGGGYGGGNGRKKSVRVVKKGEQPPTTKKPGDA